MYEGKGHERLYLGDGGGGCCCCCQKAIKRYFRNDNNVGEVRRGSLKGGNLCIKISPKTFLLQNRSQVLNQYYINFFLPLCVVPFDHSNSKE
jgi:hypothetical protein